MAKDSESEPVDLDHIEADIRHLARPIRDIHLDPDNCRKHTEKNIRKIGRSLTEYGQQKPIVANGEGICIAGNGTLMAARTLGWGWIAVSQTSLEGHEQRGYAIADNAVGDGAAGSEWDEELLKAAVEMLGEDVETGFDDDEIALMLETQNDDEAIEVSEAYQVVVECEDETEQHAIYERLKAEGLRCRLLML